MTTAIIIGSTLNYEGTNELVASTLDRIKPKRVIVGDGNGTHAHARDWARSHNLGLGLWIHSATRESGAQRSDPQLANRMMDAALRWIPASEIVVVVFDTHQMHDRTIRRAKALGLRVVTTTQETP